MSVDRQAKRPSRSGTQVALDWESLGRTVRERIAKIVARQVDAIDVEGMRESPSPAKPLRSDSGEAGS